MQPKSKIIIVDDHKMFLDGLRSILEPQPHLEIVMTAKNGQNVEKYLTINTEEAIALVVMDLNMPEYDGAQLNRFIKKNHPHIKTLVVSMLHDVQTVRSLTQDHIDGYLPKNAPKEELLKAIETILDGEKYFAQTIKDAYLKGMAMQDAAPEQSLSKREKEVLRLIAMEQTTQEIADQLFLSKHTIESYRKNLISKLGVRNLAGLTKYAIKLGLID